MANHIRTTVLLAVLTAFLIGVGGMLGGRQGMLIALVLAAGMNFFSYWFSDKVVLRIYGARPVSRHQAPELFAPVENLTRRAGLPMPKICVIPARAPNAFATGRNPEHAVVAVTEGLLELLDRDELEGVLAHELGHVKNRDILVGTIAATLAGAVMIMANMARWSALFGGARSDDEGGGGGMLGLIAMSILAPLAAVVIQMAVSRSREYLADATAADLTGHPEGLAGALEKLGAYSRRVPMNAAPSTAHMFIVNPLAGGGLMSLFSTHPPLERRIARLRGRPPAERRPRSEDDPGLSHAGRAFWDRLQR